MGIRDYLTGLLAQPSETKEAYGSNGKVMFQEVGTGYHRKQKYEDFAKEGYSENAVVYRCVNEIARGVAAIPFKVYDRDVELEAHPLISLLMRPNPLMAQSEYFEQLVAYLMLSGNSYAVMSGPDNQAPQELHLLRPDRMRVKAGESYIPQSYEYVTNGVVRQRYDVDPMNGQSVIKHFKLFHPLNDYYGMSPIQAASTDIDQHNLAARHNVNLLSNGARPTGAVVFNPRDAKSGMPRQLTPEQRSQVISDLDARFSGQANAGRTMLLEGDFDWKEMGLSPRDMDFLQLKNMSARDIALCYGVPGQLVGIPDSNTYSNMAEARLALYEETIIPLARRIESDLNEWLSPLYGDGISMTFDIDQIPAMAERRAKIYENVIQGVREGIISRNEARDRLGLSPIDGGDDVYIQANLFPLGSPQSSAVDEADAEKAFDAYAEAKLDEYPDGEPVDARLPDAYELGTTTKNCGNCVHYEDGVCDQFGGAEVRSEYVCGKWAQSEDESKAESDVNLKPTEEMAREAQRGLDMRKEFNRGGTAVGVARARQLINRDNLSPSTVRRMNSFFARHEVDKRAEGFRQGEDGYPSAGKIAWLLWGGDAGQSWARRKSKELEAQKSTDSLLEEFWCESVVEEKATAVSDKIKEALKNKVSDHNDKYGNTPSKRVTQGMLEAVFRRGVGAYRTNPESVRPSVTSPDQWGLGRVNAFLRAVRTGRFQSGKFDTDLLPDGHPLKTKK
jgi:HK97 family phage portal protein